MLDTSATFAVLFSFALRHTGTPVWMRAVFENGKRRIEDRLLSNVFVYTASGERIPVIGVGDVGGIPECLHVPTLEKELLVWMRRGERPK